MTSRRTLLAFSALAPLAAFGISGCASNSTATTIGTEVVTDIGLAANGIAALFTGVETLLPTSLYSTLENDTNIVAADAEALVATMTQAAANAPLSQIEADAGQFLTDITPYVASNTTLAQILADVQTILPVALAAAGVFITSAPLKAVSAPSAEVIAAARGRLALLPKAKHV